MKSNYKRLGDYIRQVDVRNKDDERYNLLGVSVEKCFISSIANTVGTDWHNYKIIKKGQFCYIPDTSRRGDKIGIAHLTDKEIGLVSAVYTVFEVWNKELVPEYLMLWFKRPEFDRYARYHSHGSVREIFDWEEMCNVELPVPPIEEQEKIVDAYQKIETRIALKKKINENLEAQASTLFNDFFMAELDNTEHTFGEYVSFVQGTQVPVEEQLTSNEINTVRFVRIIDYTTDGQEHPRYIYPSNNSTYINEKEVAVVRYGNIGLIGRRFSGIIANNLFKVNPKSDEITNHFIYYYLNHPKIQRILKASEESSAMPAIKHSTVANLPINIIGGDNLRMFELFADRIERVIMENKREIISLFQMSTNILSSLVSLSR